MTIRPDKDDPALLARLKAQPEHSEPAMVAAHKAGRTVARIEFGLQTIRNTYATLHERTAFDAGYFAELRRAKEENGT
jgi:hypothetical protein